MAADIRLKAQSYNSKSETSGSKGGYKSRTYSASASQRDTNKSRKNNQRKSYITPPARMASIERGEGITCIDCGAWCTRGDNYVCSCCRLDNNRQATVELRKYTDQ